MLKWLPLNAYQSPYLLHTLKVHNEDFEEASPSFNKSIFVKFKLLKNYRSIKLICNQTKRLSTFLQLNVIFHN